MTGRGPETSWVYRGTAAIGLGLMRSQRWQIAVRGTHHLPASGGAVIAANHISFWDFLTVALHPYVHLGRPVRILAKASLFAAPVIGVLMRRAGHIPVQRGSGARALSAAIAALRRGELILVMPEQTISPAFELLSLKPGAVRMAAAAGVPLIPAVSWGSHRFHTVGRRPRLRWRLPVTVAFDEPLRPPPDVDVRAANSELESRLRAMLHQVQQDYPDGTPQGAWWVPARLGGSAPTPEEARAYLEQLAARWRR